MAVLTQEDVICALSQFCDPNVIQAGRSAGQKHSNARCGLAWTFVGASLRVAQGVLGLAVSWVIIAKSSEIVPLFADFAALNFIAQLDNIAFVLAQIGIFGRKLKSATDEVKTYKNIPSPKTTRTTSMISTFSFASTLVVMFSLWGVLVVKEQHLSGLACEEISIQLDAPFGSFGGKYVKLNFTVNNRAVYERRPLMEKLGFAEDLRNYAVARLVVSLDCCAKRGGGGRGRGRRGGQPP